MSARGHGSRSIVDESRGSLVIEDPAAPPQASWAKPAAVECYAFAGNPKAVARMLYSVRPDVVKRMCYALLLQSDTKADIHIFERATPEDEKGPVAMWDGTSLDMLPSRIVAFLMADTAISESHGGIR